MAKVVEQIRVGARGREGDRSRIGMIVVLFSLAGVVVAAIVAIVSATSRQRPDMARLVFTSALPLLGTWVGTVLAFYFARENLDAATQSTQALMRGAIDPGTPVRDVMIRREQIVAHKVPVGTDPKSVRLKDLADTMSQHGFHRIPVVDSSDVVAYVIHDSTIARFVQQLQPPDPSLPTQTIADLLAIPELEKAVTAFGHVIVSAPISEARVKMRSIDNCNDVFVSALGVKTDPVLGWLTNTLLASIS